MERSHCSKEFEEYEEKLNKQIEQISNCLSEKNLTNQEKRKCVLDYINKSLDPIFKCSKKKQTYKNKQKIKVKTKPKIKTNIKSSVKPKIYIKQQSNSYQSQKQTNQPTQLMQPSLGRFDTPISTETIGLYINSIKNK
jgi:hypothetical protein